MKKLLLITCFLAVLCFQGKAQNDWQCVYPTKKVYFEDENKLVYCIRIDSTFNDNTILYPFSDLHQIDWGCYSVTSGSWLSKYITIDEGGNTFFVNGNNQQFFIKSQAALNETWDVFANDNIKVKGEIISIDNRDVLGVEDSVKTISFSVYDLDDTPVSHRLNQISIEVGKNSGLIKTINFYYFEHTTDSYNWFGEFNLIGISEPQLGFQNINLREQYYDFQVGDEFHIYHAETPVLGYGGPSYENNTIHRYISRTDYEDSIVYYYERKINTNIPKDTLKQTIIKGLLFNTEPNELYAGVSKVMITNTPLPKMYKIGYDLMHYFGDSCLRSYPTDVCYTDPTYYLGLGGPYYECCGLWTSKYCYDLVYYKKGDTEWGTPFVLPVLEYEKDIAFSIYPNPAENYITVKSVNNEISDNTILEIYDIQGRKYLSKQFDSSEFIDISSLKPGYYMVKLIRKDKAIAHIKMVKL